MDRNNVCFIRHANKEKKQSHRNAQGCNSLVNILSSVRILGIVYDDLDNEGVLKSEEICLFGNSKYNSYLNTKRGIF